MHVSPGREGGEEGRGKKENENHKKPKDRLKEETGNGQRGGKGCLRKKRRGCCRVLVRTIPERRSLEVEPHLTDTQSNRPCDFFMVMAMNLLLFIPVAVSASHGSNVMVSASDLSLLQVHADYVGKDAGYKSSTTDTAFHLKVAAEVDKEQEFYLENVTNGLEHDEVADETRDEEEEINKCKDHCYNKKHENKSWEEKCAWKNCDGCNECTPSPTRSPTVAPTPPPTDAPLSYRALGSGYCEDFLYLEVGKYPEHIKSDRDGLYSLDKVEECMKRCLKDASSEAFYVRNKEQTCACSLGNCTKRITNADKSYTSYKIVKAPPIYTTLGSGYCTDYKYLPSGTNRLLPNDDLYSPDPVEECMERCVLAFSNSSAFWVEDKTQNCGCAEECKFRKSADKSYTSYKRVVSE